MPRVQLIPEPDFETCLKVCRNLRPRDHEEIFATRWTESPEVLARDVVQAGPFRWAALLDGEPVALIGAFPRWPRVWSVWAFGTDDWPKVVRTLTRHVLRVMWPAIENSDAVRVDCMALADHEGARRWLEALGAKPENVLASWGKSGQTFVCYAWTRETTKGFVFRPRCAAPAVETPDDGVLSSCASSAPPPGQ